jgi:membrane protease YdiL (CAAX protease family)
MIAMHESSAGATGKFGAESLLITATACVAVFYYLLRADTVGVYSVSRGWTPLTVPPLGAAGHYLAAALVLGVVPLLAARLLAGIGPRSLGLGAGDWRRGLILVAIGIPVAILAGRIGAASPAMRAVYPLDPAVGSAARAFIPYAIVEFLYYGAWEVLFRGVLLFGLRARVGGPLAVVIQTALSVTAHFGRPLNETFAALPAGLVFGAATLRLRSIWYIAVLHWLVATSMEWAILSAR